MQGVVDDWHQVVLEEKIAVENQGFVDCVLTESLYIHIYIYVYDPKPQTRRYLATFHSKINLECWEMGATRVAYYSS